VRSVSRRTKVLTARVRLATVAMRSTYESKMENGDTEMATAALTVQSASSTPSVAPVKPSGVPTNSRLPMQTMSAGRAA